MSETQSQEEPQAANTPSIDDFLSNMETQIRQEISKWWNDVKHLRPESLPWFSNGIKGLVRKLYYNNSKENPDWNNYKAKEESVVKMSLAEYGLIRSNLQSLIEQEAPAGADDAINLLIKRLMPVIKSGFEQIASLHQTPAPTVTTQEAPPEVVPTPKRPPRNKKPDPVPQIDPVDDKTGSEDPLNKSNTAVPGNSNEPPDNSGSNDSGSSGNGSNSASPPPPAPANEGSWYSRNLMTYLDSPKEKDDKEKLISSLGEMGLAGKMVGKGKRIEIEINPKDPNSSAEALVKFFEHLAKSLDSSDLAKLGLKEPEEKSLLNSEDGEAPFYHSYEFYDSLASNKNKFAIFSIAKDLRSMIHEYLEKNVYVASNENYVIKLKRMLSENTEENLNLILAKQVPFEKKKEFFLNKIRSK